VAQTNQKAVTENIMYNKITRYTWPTKFILLEFNKVTDICEKNNIAEDLQFQQTQSTLCAIMWRKINNAVKNYQNYIVK